MFGWRSLLSSSSFLLHTRRAERGSDRRRNACTRPCVLQQEAGFAFSLEWVFSCVLFHAERELHPDSPLLKPNMTDLKGVTDLGVSFILARVGAWSAHRNSNIADHECTRRADEDSPMSLFSDGRHVPSSEFAAISEDVFVALTAFLASQMNSRDQITPSSRLSPKGLIGPVLRFL